MLEIPIWMWVLGVIVGIPAVFIILFLLFLGWQALMFILDFRLH